MNVKKCDRCGGIYEENTITMKRCYGLGDGVVNHMLFVDVCQDTLQHYDLCDGCIRKLLGFLDGDETYDPNYYTPMPNIVKKEN